MKSTSFCLWIKRILKIVETAIWFAFFEYVVALPSGAFGKTSVWNAKNSTLPLHKVGKKKNRGLGPENSIDHWAVRATTVADLPKASRSTQPSH